MVPMQDTNSEYTVLARRFRPQTFDEVVGQEMVAQALRNAISTSRVAHAYLFTGARGVGKTSMARILAKSLNCPQSDGTDPCNECEICQGIAEGSDVDVLEIDGASNRGIEDIRSLRANVNVKSMRTHYKVYIIDEVHMLTREAFNALLKTLEEPPPTVKFIFCTTEPNKLPDTILSRCQRFDFGTIDTSSIGERLKQIAAVEGIAVEDAAIELVSRRAAGSMRDSQSLFDQLLAFGGDPITTADVHRLFGTADDERLVQLFDAVIGGDKAGALQLLDTALEEGVQLGEITTQLLDYLRDLMVLASGAEQVRLSAVSSDSRPRLNAQAKQWGLETIVAAMEILSQAKGQIPRVSFGRALAELALVRMALLQHLHDLSDLILQVKSGQVKSGQVKSGAVTSRQQSAPPAPARTPTRLAVPPPSPTPVPPEKKTEQPDDSPPTQAPESEKSPPTIEFCAANKDAIWAEVLLRVADMLRSNLKRATNTAISEPNALEIEFPKNYHISLDYCQRREPLSRLESTLEQVTGKHIRILMKLAENPASHPAAAPTTPQNGQSPEAAKRIDPEADPLVKKALTVFNATVVKIEER